MRIVTARVNHETNTFSPLATPLAAFNPLWGAEALAAGRGSTTAGAPGSGVISAARTIRSTTSSGRAFRCSSSVKTRNSLDLVMGKGTGGSGLQ